MAECISPSRSKCLFSPCLTRRRCGRGTCAPAAGASTSKRTGLSGGYLIWPIRKNDLFAGKDFDLLVLVKNDWNVGFPRGWLEKAEFSRLKEVAGEGHKLDPGTWHVGDDGRGHERSARV